MKRKIDDLEYQIDEYEKYLSKYVSREEFESELSAVLSSMHWDWLGPDRSLGAVFYRDTLVTGDADAEKRLPDIVSFLIINDLARVFKLKHLAYDDLSGEFNMEETIIIPANRFNPFSPSKYYDSSNLEEIISEEIEEVLKTRYEYWKKMAEGEEFDPNSIPEKMILSDIVEIK